MSRAIPKWELVEGDLATPLGFRAAALAAGIKKTRDALDLALIFSDSPATTAAGVFTTNRVAAAPVLLSRQNLVGKPRDVAAPSSSMPEMPTPAPDRRGCTRRRKRPALPRELLGIEPSQVLVASTGVIGVPLNAGPYSSTTPPLKRKALPRECQGCCPTPS